MARTGTATLAALAAMEAVQRRLHPPEIPKLRADLEPFRDELAQALPSLRAVEAPAALGNLKDALLRSAELSLEACTVFCDDAAPGEWIYSILRSMRTFAHALETLYPLHRLPPVGRFFAERAVHGRLEELDPEPAPAVSVGLHASGSAQNVGERGGFCLYVPEYYAPGRSWPLVVALHGGSGTGREYLWVWVREARSRGFLVLAPTAQGPTWSMLGPDTDGAAIAAMIEFVCGRWTIDRSRILLTGLSDGGTYGLSLALRDDSPFSAVAPVASTLHPRFTTSAGITVARGKRIYMVHGALDWMFAVEQARFAHGRLQAAGADIVYREIADLSHTYPREENDRILTWFDPSLGLGNTGVVR